MGGTVVRAGDHVLVICYMRGAAFGHVRARRLRTVPRGGVDLAPLGRRKSVGPAGPPFLKESIGIEPLLSNGYPCRLRCTHTRTPLGEQHRPPGRVEPSPPSEMLGDEDGSYPMPRVCSSGTYGPGRRAVPCSVPPEGGSPTLMGVGLLPQGLPSTHIRGGRPPRRADRNSPPPGRRGRCGR